MEYVLIKAPTTLAHATIITVEHTANSVQVLYNTVLLIAACFVKFRLWDKQRIATFIYSNLIAKGLIDACHIKMQLGIILCVYKVLLIFA